MPGKKETGASTGLPQVLKALDSGKDERGYLGNPKYLDALLRVTIANCLRGSTSDDPTKIFMRETKNASRELLGYSKSMPQSAWNRPGGIDTFVAHWCGITDTDPVTRVQGGLLRMLDEIMDIVSYVGSGALPENWQWQVDAIIEEYVGILLGISPPAQAAM